MMKAKVLSWCLENRLFSPGERVCCAVSGGADSMALLDCLLRLQKELGILVSAAHFNHRLRGAESDGDEAFVRSYCKQKGVTFFVDSADVEQYARENRLSLEEAAREKRYAFLTALPVDKVATAHTADDNVETVLLHLLRGSGLRGLCGIAPKRERLVRPLLSVSREEVLTYLAQESLAWREDSSNSTDFCARNRLRHHVLPLLRQEAPQLSQVVLRQCGLLRQEETLLDELAGASLQRAEGDAWRIAPILAAPKALQRRALRLLTRQYLSKDISQRHIEALLGLLRSDSPCARFSLPGGLLAQREYDAIRFTFVPSPAEPQSALRWESCACYRPGQLPPGVLALSFEGTPEQLTVRTRQVGDTLVLANGHTKTLKRLMIDKKIPLRRRDRLLVLADGDRLVAVQGLGVSQPYAARAGEPALLVRFCQRDAL